MYPFCTSKPGRIKSNFTPIARAQTSITRPANSLPLSVVIDSGNPADSDQAFHLGYYLRARLGSIRVGATNTLGCDDDRLPSEFETGATIPPSGHSQNPAYSSAGSAASLLPVARAHVRRVCSV